MRLNRSDSGPAPSALPEALDLCAVALGAGGTIRDAVEVVATDGPAELGAKCRAVIQRCDRGATLAASLGWLHQELGPGFHPFTGALLMAHTQGGSVVPLLARLGHDANTARRRRGEIRARRLPVSLLVPLVVCSLPAVIIGVVIPMAVVSLRQIAI